MKAVMNNFYKNVCLDFLSLLQMLFIKGLR